MKDRRRKNIASSGFQAVLQKRKEGEYEEAVFIVKQCLNTPEKRLCFHQGNMRHLEVYVINLYWLYYLTNLSYISLCIFSYNTFSPAL